MTTPIASDEQLLDAWRRGHSLAGHELFKRYSRSITVFFRRRFDGDVEDLVQNTFERLLNGLQKPVESFRAYLFGIARNILREQYRATKRETDRRRSLEIVTDAVEDTYEDHRMGHEQTKLLVAALRTLSLETQIILELRFWQSMSMREIAYVLELEPGAVRVRVSRARRRLEQQMHCIATSSTLLRTTLHRMTAWEAEIEAALDARARGYELQRQ